MIKRTCRKPVLGETVSLDIQILINSAQESIRTSELTERYQLPYVDISRLVFDGLRDLLDPEIEPARQRKALARLRRYSGEVNGTVPITSLAQAAIAAKLDTPGILLPSRSELEKGLSGSDVLMDGIGQLFRADGVVGYEAPLRRLKAELVEYNDFIRGKVLPRASDEFRLPPSIYLLRLRAAGVDNVSASELASMARAIFSTIQNEMQHIAPTVAKALGTSQSDYRAVIWELRKRQIDPGNLLTFYQNRLTEIEAIIRKQHLVTLPSQPVRIRMATDAESAAVPSPFFRKPQLVRNTGQYGEFVISFRDPLGPSGLPATARMDDWTTEAMSWSIIAHEARPGHELQFNQVVRQGTSLARSQFSDSSVTTEGWALYAEDIMRPYLPLDGQLMSLQLELLRAARAFLDPELQLGLINREQAHTVLTQEVGISDALADFEIERYTFRLPGQGPAYLYGLLKWRQLRDETHKRLGNRFDLSQFHDFVLSQGLLPPPQMRDAVSHLFPSSGTGNMHASSCQTLTIRRRLK